MFHFRVTQLIGIPFPSWIVQGKDSQGSGKLEKKILDSINDCFDAESVPDSPEPFEDEDFSMNNESDT